MIRALLIVAAVLFIGVRASSFVVAEPSDPSPLLALTAMAKAPAPAPVPVPEVEPEPAPEVKPTPAPPGYKCGPYGCYKVQPSGGPAASPCPDGQCQPAYTKPVTTYRPSYRTYRTGPVRRFLGRFRR